MAAGLPDGQRFPRTRRLTRGTEIREVLRRGKRSGTPFVDVFDSASPFEFSRAGVVVPRHGHDAVARNLLKRRLREVMRRDVLPRLRQWNANVDIIVRARREAYGAAFTELRSGLMDLVARRWAPASSSR